MNERILELAKQAGDYVNEVYTPPVRSKTPGKMWEDGHIGWHEQFHEKFAELLIRECTNMLPEDSIRNADGVHMFYVIREHFGVQE